MPLKFINLRYDFVLFFASGPMRSRNSSTVVDAFFYVCSMSTLSVKMLNRHTTTSMSVFSTFASNMSDRTAGFCFGKPSP